MIAHHHTVAYGCPTMRRGTNGSNYDAVRGIALPRPVER